MKVKVGIILVALIALLVSFSGALGQSLNVNPQHKYRRAYHKAVQVAQNAAQIDTGVGTNEVLVVTDVIATNPDGSSAFIVAIQSSGGVPDTYVADIAVGTTSTVHLRLESGFEVPPGTASIFADGSGATGFVTLMGYYRNKKKGE